MEGDDDVGDGDGKCARVREGGLSERVRDWLEGMMSDGRRWGKSWGSVHSSNTSKQNPFCGIAITSESFVCNPVQQFLADVWLYRVHWSLQDIESVLADE
jgi:hypothetical protein